MYTKYPRLFTGWSPLSFQKLRTELLTNVHSGLPASAGWILLVHLFFSPVWAKPGVKARPVRPDSSVSHASGNPLVDSTKVHHLYMDGEFEAAMAMLEDNLKATRQYSHDDSVFIYKHLGVMYAAQYETREKGKYYMYRLLQVEPTAKIMDMYASDMIYMIFKNIQEEYEQKRLHIVANGQNEVKQDSLAKSDQKHDPAKAAANSSSGPSKSSGSANKWVWTGVAVATVAVGIGAYILVSDAAKTPKKEVEF
jgi:hypothetical protein